MGRGQQETDSFYQVLGQKRGLELKAPSPYPKPAAISDKERQIYGKRADDVALLWSYVRSLPYPLQMPLWMWQAFDAAFVQPSGDRNSQDTPQHRLMSDDGDMVPGLFGKARQQFYNARRIEKPSQMQEMQVQTLVKAAGWFMVFPDYLTEAERKFLQLCWQEMFPDIPEPKQG